MNATAFLEALGVNLALSALVIAARLVRPSAAPGGLLVGTALYAGAGRSGFAVLVAFFVVGTTLTKTGYRRKAARGLAEPSGGRRGSAHALANGGVAAVLALGIPLWPEGGAILAAGLTGAFAAALADTAGSEVGPLLGARAFVPHTLRPVAPGTEGAISLGGTIAGVLGAALLAAVALAGGLVERPGAWAALAGGISGSYLESVAGSLGATRRLGHMALNAGNTVIGALVAMSIAAALGGLE